MPVQFSSVSRASQVAGVKLLVYSGAGMGKTVLSATLGPGSVMISAESGLLSLRQQNLERLFGVGNPSINYDMPVLTVTSIQDVVEAYTWCAQSHEARAFHSVAIDSLSEIAEQCLNTAKRQVRDPRQAYGELSERMETLIRQFRDLPNKNVYMAAKMEPMKDEMTGAIKYGPAMPGRKLGPAVPYYFDEVFRLGVNKTPQGESYRFLQTQPDIQYDAKDRSGALAPLEYPHLGSIIAKIQGA